MAYKHYINIIDKFREFQVAQNQLDYFGQGDIWEVNAFPKMTFPAMWVNTVSAIPQTPNDGNLIQTIEYNFNILFMDAVQKGEQNELDVLNDTQLMAIDLIKDIKANWDDADVSQYTLTPFTERFSDWLSGWNLNMTIVFDFPSNYCEIAVTQ